MKSFPLFFALLVFLAAGCGDRQNLPEEITPEVGITVWPATRQTDLGNFSVSIQPVESSIERNRHFSVDVSIAPAVEGEAPGKDLKISVDADMPAHRHGMNTRPEVTKFAENQYRADGMLFHMGGDWVISVRVGSDLATFPVSVE